MKREKTDKIHITHKPGWVKETIKGNKVHSTVRFPEIKLKGYGYVTCASCTKLFRQPCCLWGTENCFNKKTTWEVEQTLIQMFRNWKTEETHKCKKCSQKEEKESNYFSFNTKMAHVTFPSC